MGNNQSKPMVAEKTYMFQGDGPMVDFTVAANLVGDETFKTKDISAAHTADPFPKGYIVYMVFFYPW